MTVTSMSLTGQSLGGSVTYNVLQAKNVYLTDKANYMNQEVVVRNTIRNLNFMMGEAPTNTWDFSETFEADTSEYILADLLSKMKASNQILKNQYTNLLLRENETSLQKGELLTYPLPGCRNGLWRIAGPTPAGQSGSGNLSPYGNLRLILRHL